MDSSHSSPAGTARSAVSPIAAPFTQAWIQALTLAADNPLARTIKPQLELINTLSRSRAEADRAQAAKELWQVAQREGLCELLDILPINRAQWVFQADDNFLYQRRDAANSAALQQTVAADTDGAKSAPANEPTPTTSAPTSGSFEAWLKAIGLEPLEVLLTAEVFSGDWASLVRSEAVRLQKSLSLSAVAQATNLQLPCTARWDTRGWSITFDQVDWVVIRYEELPVMERPSYAEIEGRVNKLLSQANATLLAKQSTNCNFRPLPEAWEESVASLAPLHANLRKNTGHYSAWLVRTWYCVWPIVYREQHVLRERADIDVLRRELKACLDAQPRLCIWMFLFAKLICQSQLSTGLGFCADFSD